MSASFALTSFLEIAAVILLLIGFLYEKQLIAFERKLGHVIRHAIRLRRVRKSAELRAARQPQKIVAPSQVTLRVAKPKKRHTERVA